MNSFKKEKNGVKIRFLAILLLFLPISTELRAQIDDVIEDLATIDNVESESWEQTYDILSELQDNPLNLNTASPEDLRLLPFLNEYQIEDLSEFLHRYGAIRSEGELAMIESLDENTRRLLLRFVYFGDEEQAKLKLSDIARKGRHELLFTGRAPFYERRGDKEVYLGPPYRHSLRYTFHYQQQFKVGFVGSQDAGEPFFTNGNGLGYDHYSFYVQAQKLGRLKNITIGHYRLNFGQGLVINNDFSFGKLIALTTADRNQSIVRGHSSRSEFNYLQGAAAVVALTSDLDLTAFVSYRNIDVTPNDDNLSIRTILTSGYHRTNSEMQRRRNASEFVGGGRFAFRRHRWNAATTVVYDAFNKPLKPVLKRTLSTLYREIQPEGQHFWNASIDYGYRHPRFTFNGETATGSCGGVATINTLNLKLLKPLSLIAIQRFYSYRYYALHSNSIGEGGAAQNESGILVGMTWHPSRRLTLTGYTDYAYFPWARYQVSKSSHVWDNLLSATWRRGKWKVNARYKLRLREKDLSDHTALQTVTEHRGRTSVVFTENHWNLKTQIDLSHTGNEENNAKSFGWMASQSAGFRARNVSVDALFAYFRTDDYDSRLYLYEHGPLYAFSFPMFYGHGIRYMLMAQWQPRQNILLTAKMGTTNYFDRATISSGYQQINASSMTDLDVQLRLKF
ncbi:MAG: helix-hairpin-helix domain-containing protein [Prevotella sp.]|nr:helix-hairpin-helix domain-containing protein [Prevotella sp.]